MKLFLLNVYRAISRIMRKQIFSSIYAGDLKGFRFLVDTNNEYFNGSYEKDSFGIVLNEIRQNPSAVIYDMGANLGYFSLLCANHGEGKSTVYAFEPIPGNMNILCRHLLMNKVANVLPVNMAVSDQFGIIDFSADNSSVSYTYKQSSEYYGNRAINIKVAIISLDTLTGKFGFSKPDVLKIDVEGAELDVLNGATETIKKYRPRILLSTHEAHVKGIEQGCLSFMKEMNYHCKELPSASGRMKGLTDYWCTPN